MLGSSAIASAPIAELRADNDTYPSGQSSTLALHSINVQVNNNADVNASGQDLLLALHSASVIISHTINVSGASLSLTLNSAVADLGVNLYPTGLSLIGTLHNVSPITDQYIEVTQLSMWGDIKHISVSHDNNIYLSKLSLTAGIHNTLVWKPLHSGYGTWTDIPFGELFYGDLFGIADTPIASIELAAPLRRNPPQSWGAVPTATGTTWTDVIC